jgi:mono/diheme cytochrome c family protein
LPWLPLTWASFVPGAFAFLWFGFDQLQVSVCAYRTPVERNRNPMKSSLQVFARLLLGGLIALLTSIVVQAADSPDGAAVYKQKCQMCHGADGKGFPAIKTPDMTDPKWQASLSDKEMTDVIKNGKKGTPMPAFADKLKDDEIQAVIKFIRSFDSSKKK